jgi:hypothetical protein
VRALGLAMLAVLACRRAPAEPGFVALQGGDEGSTARAVVERTGELATAVIQLDDAPPELLQGQLRGERFEVAQQAGVGEPGEAARVRWKPGEPLAGVPDDFERAFAGVRGGIEIRVRLRRLRNALRGELVRADDGTLLATLQGELDPATGAFHLWERRDGALVGRDRGAFASPSLLVARWEPADGQPGELFVLEAAQLMPPAAELGSGVRVAPLSFYRHVEPACIVDLVWPGFPGLKPEPVRARLEAALRVFAGGDRQRIECGAPDRRAVRRDSVQYTVVAASPRAVALELTASLWRDGQLARGLTCAVADLVEGRLVVPAQLIRDEVALSRLVAAALGRRSSGKLVEARFADDAIAPGSMTLCLRPGGVIVRIDVPAFGPPAIGRTAVALEPSAVAPLLARDPAVDALLH